MSKLFRSLLLAGGIVASVNASAITSIQVSAVDLGNLSNGVTSFYESVGPGFFADAIDFSIGGHSSVAAGLQSINIAPLLGISNLNVSLYSASGAFLGSGNNINLGSVQAGKYVEVVTGSGTGSAGGVFAGSIAVSPVPEASTMAMLLAGLGLLGLTAFRRKV
jgi:hypothetical protein